MFIYFDVSPVSSFSGAWHNCQFKGFILSVFSHEISDSLDKSRIPECDLSIYLIIKAPLKQLFRPL